MRERKIEEGKGRVRSSCEGQSVDRSPLEQIR